MTDQTEWHYARGGQAMGPVSQRDFERLVDDGTIRPDTLVWSDGMTDWQPLEELTAAAPATRTAPPLVQPSGSSPAADDFVGAIQDGFQRYFDFETRSTRSQYWYWVLAVVLFNTLVAGFLGLLGSLISVALIIPGVAVAVRRLHDSGRSGWWFLLIFLPVIGWIVLIVFYCQPTSPETNQWGPPPG